MTPYTCKRFTVDAKGKADTDIEHIVALAEAHDSALAPSLRHALANALDGLSVTWLKQRLSRRCWIAVREH